MVQSPVGADPLPAFGQGENLDPLLLGSRGTLAMLCIAASVSVRGMDSLLSTCPSFLLILLI